VVKKRIVTQFSLGGFASKPNRSKKMKINESLIALALFLAYQAALLPCVAQQDDLEHLLAEIKGKAPNYEKLVQLYKLRSYAPGMNGTEAVKEAVAAGLLFLEKSAVYQKKIAP